MSFLSAPNQKRVLSDSDADDSLVGCADTRTGETAAGRHLPSASGRHGRAAAKLRRGSAGRRRTAFDRCCRRLVLRRLTGLRHGPLRVIEGDEVHRFPVLDEPPSGDSAEQVATIQVRSSRFWRRIALGGSLGAAESYLRAEWECGQLVEVMRILARNMPVLSQMEGGLARIGAPWRAVANWFRRNTRRGSRRNIAAHYDLSNEFFALMLDPTMTYSCGVFASPNATMEEASVAKYDRICRKLQLSPRDHVLEIGCGWGGFAIHAAGRYGCRLTATTISDAQYTYAKGKIQQAGLSDRIALVKQDYRDLVGQYDKLVSIEMIEAVGEKYLNTYFGQCAGLLKADGMMLLQAITIPDHRYESYRSGVDFIQRYVFPGGFLPCLSAIGIALRKKTDFRLFHQEDLAPHYAETLASWRARYWENISSVRQLGFDELFIRTWHYYLCYCEAGFRERQTGVSQMLLTKPACRRSDLALGF